MANGHGGKRKGAGRPVGATNAETRMVKEAIEQAFVAGGGQEWLNRWARENENVFFGSMFPKLLPVQMQHTGQDGGVIEITWRAQDE